MSKTIIVIDCVILPLMSAAVVFGATVAIREPNILTIVSNVFVAMSLGFYLGGMLFRYLDWWLNS